MTMTKFYCVMLLASSFVFQSSANAKPRVIDVTGIDVAGVRLGMTPEAARQALTNQGFQLSDDEMYLSWSAQVAAEAGKYVNTPKDTTRAIWSTKADGADYQEVSVSYGVSVDGSRVKGVRYTRPARLGNILKLATDRYGQPTRIDMNTYHYCPQVKGCPTSLFSKADFPSLEVHHPFSEYGLSVITLTQGTAADQRLDAKFREAVIAIAPNYGKAAF